MPGICSGYDAMYSCWLQPQKICTYSVLIAIQLDHQCMCQSDCFCKEVHATPLNFIALRRTKQSLKLSRSPTSRLPAQARINAASCSISDNSSRTADSVALHQRWPACRFLRYRTQRRPRDEVHTTCGTRFKSQPPRHMHQHTYTCLA